MSDKFWHKDQDRGMIGGGASLIAGAAGSSVCGICFSDYGKCEHSKVSTGGQGGAGHDPSNYGKVVVDDKCYSHEMIKALIAERDNALAQVEQLSGIKPELPPRPPQGDGLLRYGIKWNGDRQPISTPMDDGYWTPYHLALAQNAELVAQVGGLRQGLIDARKWVDERNNVCDKSKDFCDTLTLLIEATPAQHLRDRDAEVVEKYYYMGWEHSLSTKADDGDHYGCGKRLAKEFAEKVRRGEV